MAKQLDVTGEPLNVEMTEPTPSVSQYDSAQSQLIAQQ